MDKKKLILLKLEELKYIYQQDPSKKWNLKSLIYAIHQIQKYDSIIVSGEQIRKEIKGIGDKISKRIDEILETGNLAELHTYEPVNQSIDQLLSITGVGMVRAKEWLALGIRTIEDVRKAVKNHVITINHHIAIGIQYYEDLRQPIPRKEIDNFQEKIKKVLFTINHSFIFEICGSYRRGALQSGDIDILISHPSYMTDIHKEHFLEKMVQACIQEKIIINEITSKGSTKFMGICQYSKKHTARRIDIRVVNYNAFYATLIYFTGNKEFNLYLRKKAIEQKYRLNEYGLIDLQTGTTLFLKSEHDLFDQLHIPYVAPEDRNV